MDDQTFDEQTADDWIAAIEKDGKTLRDDDIYPQLNAWLSRTSPREILEIGSGQGICSARIDLGGRNYTGIEPSVFLTRRAQQLFANRQFVVGNAYALPVADEAFDAAFSVLVWHLLADLPGATRELGRVLKRGGHFLIITANPAALDSWKALYPDAQREGKRLEGTMGQSRDVLYLHSLEELEQALQDVDLKVTGTESFRDDMLISIQGRRL